MIPSGDQNSLLSWTKGPDVEATPISFISKLLKSYRKAPPIKKETMAVTLRDASSDSDLPPTKATLLDRHQSVRMRKLLSQQFAGISRCISWQTRNKQALSAVDQATLPMTPNEPVKPARKAVSNLTADHSRAALIKGARNRAAAPKASPVDPGADKVILRTILKKRGKRARKAGSSLAAANSFEDFGIDSGRSHFFVVLRPARATPKLA